jgi:hypothetical protein
VIIYSYRARRPCTRQEADEEQEQAGRLRLLPAGPKLPSQPAGGGGGNRLGASCDLSTFGPWRLHHDRELRGRDGRRRGRRGVHHHGGGREAVPVDGAVGGSGGARRGQGGGREAVPVDGAVGGSGGARRGQGGGRVPDDAGGHVPGQEQGDRQGAQRHPGPGLPHQGRRDGAGQGGAGVEEQGRRRHRRGGRVQGARQEVEGLWIREPRPPSDWC